MNSLPLETETTVLASAFVRGEFVECAGGTGAASESTMSTALSHAVRPHLLAGPATYELASDALVVRSDTGDVRIPYADITSVRLIDYPNFGGSQKQFTVKSRGHRKLTVRSHHYVSLGNFENRSASFAPVFRELCRRAGAANPSAEFIRGSNALRVVWAIVLGCAVLGWIGWTAAVVENPAGVSSTIPGALVLSLLTLLGLRTFRNSKALHFDPHNPPVG